MNTSSHILMGKFLYQYLERHYNIKLDLKSFIIGNVLPDFCPSFLIRPHYLKNHVIHVQNIIQLLVLRNPFAYDGKKYSHFLGVLCHFYSDFFCYAHSDSFRGALSEHIEYERRLHRYFAENLKEINSVRFVAPYTPVIDADGIYRQFERLHSYYLLSGPSLENDLLYAVMACIDLVVLISGCAVGEDAGESVQIQQPAV